MENPSSLDDLASLRQHYKRGVELLHAQRWEEAEAIYRSIVAQTPNYAEARHFLAVALSEQGKREEALPEFRAFLVHAPNSWSAYNNLSKTFQEMNRPAQALEAARRALALHPDFPEAFNNLSIALRDLNRFDEAIDACRCALKLKPDVPKVWNSLGVLLERMSRPADSLQAYQWALKYDSQYAPAWFNLALAYKDTGQLDEALASFDKAKSIDPNESNIGSSHLFTLNYHPDYDAPAIFAHAQQWNERFAIPLGRDIPPHDNDPSPQRRLRIGYLSSDFRVHCATLFTVPLLSNHDHAQFEIFCYSSTSTPDQTTTVLRGMADQWRDISKISDSAAADLIRQDRIDILVDLTVHVGGHRLLVFARKPAPIQVTWLGYAGTTGMTAIDYRLTDPRLDPLEEQIRNPKSEIRINDPNPNDPNPNDPNSPGAVRQPGSLPHSKIGTLGVDSDFGFRISDFENRTSNFFTKEPYYSERTIRLSDSFWCYDPRATEDRRAPLPESGLLPALAAGHVTFGCLNNFCKVTGRTLELWGRAMAAVPSSQLLLFSPPGPHRQGVAVRLGVSPERVQFVGIQPRPQYLETYRRIDLCLDTLPFNGGTTSLDSLWMGVPVLTRVGRTAVGRAGWSQLHNLELTDLVAWSDEQFTRIAVEWAADLDRLSALRAGLRRRMEQSPLMDGPRFTRHVEAAFRQMWQVWCQTRI